MRAADKEPRGTRPRGGRRHQVRVNRSSGEEELRQKAHLGWAGGGAGGGAEIVNQAFQESHVEPFWTLAIVLQPLDLRLRVRASSW